eukprot:4145653-Amphidinium_carterae.1
MHRGMPAVLLILKLNVTVKTRAGAHKRKNRKGSDLNISFNTNVEDPVPHKKNVSNLKLDIWAVEGIKWFGLAVLWRA